MYRTPESVYGASVPEKPGMFRETTSRVLDFQSDAVSKTRTAHVLANYT